MPRKAAKPKATSAPSPAADSSVMAEAFDRAQRSAVNHAKATATLFQMLQEAAQTEDGGGQKFHDDFLSHFSRALVVFKREQAVERIIEFAVKFVAQAEKESSASETENAAGTSLLNATLKHLLSICHAKDKAVRFRACQAVSKLLNALDEEAEVDDDMWELLQETMLRRMTDKIPVVRVQAINALTRLQEPTDMDCPVIQAYLQRMECDSSPDVRKAAVMLIALSKTSISGVLARRRDVKESVRRAVYISLREKLDLQALSISQRAVILEDGLRDRTPCVREACGDMVIASWFDLMGKNPERLLEALDVAMRPSVCQLVADCMLVRLPELSLDIDFKAALSPVQVFWWRSFLAYHKAAGNEDKLENVVPVVSDVSKILQKHVKLADEADETNVSDAHFVVDQLLQLAALLDFSDEAGRRVMAEVTHDLIRMQGMALAHLESAADLLAAIHPAAGDRLQVLTDTLESLAASPIKAKKAAVALSSSAMRKLEVQLAGLRVDIISTQDEKEACVAAEDFGGAEKAKEKLAQLEAEQQRITAAMQPKEADEDVEEEPSILPEEDEAALTCLGLIQNVLASMSRPPRPAQIGGLLDNFVLKGIQRENGFVRACAFRCLGLCCMTDKSLAQTHALIFLQAVQVDQEGVQKTALEALFDLLTVFGLETFTVAGDDGMQAPTSTAPSSILPVVERYLDSDSDVLRTVAVEGFAKLLLLRRIASVQILSRLLLLYFNPTTKEAVELRQCLAAFFPAFAYADRSHQAMLVQSVIPTLRTILCAPTGSPIRAIRPQEFIDMVMCLTSAIEGEGAASDLGVHGSLAHAIAREVLADSGSECVRSLSKALSQLQVTDLTAHERQVLLALTQQLVASMDDRHSLKSIEKLKEMLEAQGDDPLEEEVLAQVHDETERHIQMHLADMRQRDTDRLSATQGTRRRGRSSRKAAPAESESEPEEEEQEEEENEEETRSGSEDEEVESSKENAVSETPVISGKRSTRRERRAPMSQATA